MGHERARERRRLGSILVEGRCEPRECAIALGKPDSVDRQIVDKPDVEHVLGVSAITVKRDWRIARAELHRQLGEDVLAPPEQP